MEKSANLGTSEKRSVNSGARMNLVGSEVSLKSSTKGLKNNTDNNAHYRGSPNSSLMRSKSSGEKYS